MSKTSRIWILGSSAGVAGIALLAFLLGWYPSSDPKPVMKLDSAPNCLEVGDFHAAAGKYDQALTFYTKAVSFDPNHLDSQMALADCYRILGRKDDAIATYKKAFKLDPKGDKGKTARRYIAELRKKQD